MANRDSGAQPPESEPGTRGEPGSAGTTRGSGGAGRRKHVPLRTCVACRASAAKRELIRIVRTPEGTIEVDFKGKRAGRGAYLCRRQECWDAALRQGVLGRALKVPVTSGQLLDLWGQVEQTVGRDRDPSLSSK